MTLVLLIISSCCFSKDEIYCHFRHRDDVEDLGRTRLRTAPAVEFFHWEEKKKISGPSDLLSRSRWKKFHQARDAFMLEPRTVMKPRISVRGCHVTRKKADHSEPLVSHRQRRSMTLIVMNIRGSSGVHHLKFHWIQIYKLKCFE